MLLYASKYHDIPIIVNISGRFALERGIEGRLGKNFMRRINKDGYIDVKNRKGLSLSLLDGYGILSLLILRVRFNGPSFSFLIN